MKTLLQINTSLFSDGGQSTRLANRFVATWQSHHPEGRVAVRDFARDPVPHLNAERLHALATKPDERTAEQQAVAACSDGLIEELRQADVVVLGLPMYNFGVPSTLQAYFDHIARAGVTFRYTATGPVGFLTGKKVYVLATRGGVHAGTPQDAGTPQVRALLGLLGMHDVEFIYAEGLNIDEPTRTAGLARAQDAIERLTAAA